MKVQIEKVESQILIFPEAQLSKNIKLQTCWFEDEYWREHNSIIGQSKGRYITWFVQPPESIDTSSWVLRHYYRGGMIAKITQDQFVFTGIKYTRGFREIELLQIMAKMGLPVPKGIGARIIKKGLFYTADLIMEKIEASDLVAKLQSEKLSEQQWQNIGETIAQFHKKGIFHADLNAHNILIDDSNKVWLIDFDRCDKRQVNASWQQQNIQRLQRSFLKEKGLSASFYFDDESWKNLIKGYQLNL